MAVHTRYDDKDNRLVISISGKFDFSVLKEFRKAYDNPEAKQGSVEVYMRETSSIDSSALGMLLYMQNFLKKPDGEIVISNCNGYVMKILTIAQFDKKFSIR